MSTPLRAQLRERKIQKNLVENGRLPTLEELFAGFPFAKNSIDYDIDLFCRNYLDSPENTDKSCRNSIQALIDYGIDSDRLNAARKEFHDIGDFFSLNRIAIYIACTSGPQQERIDLANTIRNGQFTWFESASFIETCVSSGLIASKQQTMEDYYKAGKRYFINEHRTLEKIEKIEAELAAEHEAQQAALDEIYQLIDEDRAEIQQTENPEGEPLKFEDFLNPGVIVVPKLADAGVTFKRELKKSFSEIEGKVLPVVKRGDLAARRNALVARWPHAADVIDTILSDLSASEKIYFRPTILVGEPGSGKTSLARQIAKEFGLPSTVFNMSGMSDSSAMGTSAQWHSARPSVPLQLVQTSGRANGLVVWDEIEKAGSSRHNGNALEALLPFLERSSARAIRDLALEVDVNLSMISHIATANSVDGIPDPLRDRMRVLTMPDPSWQHIGVLSQQIIGDIARDRGVDRRWFSDLAADELEVIKSVWPGGSLRRLRRAIEATLDSRDAFLGRA